MNIEEAKNESHVEPIDCDDDLYEILKPKNTSKVIPSIESIRDRILPARNTSDSKKSKDQNDVIELDDEESEVDDSRETSEQKDFQPQTNVVRNFKFLCFKFSSLQNLFKHFSLYLGHEQYNCMHL